MYFGWNLSLFGEPKYWRHCWMNQFNKSLTVVSGNNLGVGLILCNEIKHFLVLLQIWQCVYQATKLLFAQCPIQIQKSPFENLLIHHKYLLMLLIHRVAAPSSVKSVNHTLNWALLLLDISIDEYIFKIYPQAFIIYNRFKI